MFVVKNWFVVGSEDGRLDEGREGKRSNIESGRVLVLCVRDWGAGYLFLLLESLQCHVELPLFQFNA